MSGILNSLLQGYGAGSQIKKERDAQQKQSKLAELMSQAYSAPRDQRRDLVGQAVGVDPQAGFALQGQLSQDDDRRAKELVRHARALAAAPDQMKPQLYSQMLPQLQSMGLQGLPPQYDATVAESTQQIVEAWAGVDEQDNTPASIRELQMLHGNPELAKLDMARRQAGWQPKTLATADGYAVFDPRTNSAQPLSYGGQPAGAPAASVPAEDGTSQPVTQFTGSDGRPVAIGNDIPPHVRAQILGESDAFAAAPDGAIARLPPSDVGQRVMPPQRAQPKPSALQERLEAAKRLGASEADLRGMVVGRSPNAPKPKDSVVSAVKVAQVKNVDRGIGRIESALQALNKPGFNTGPVDAMLQRYTKNGQELEAAVGAIQNSFLSLTRVPGIGSQSDLEARIAALQYPSLDKDPEVNRRTLQHLREFAEDLKKALQNAGPAAAEPDDDVDALIGKYL